MLRESFDSLWFGSEFKSFFTFSNFSFMISSTRIGARRMPVRVAINGFGRIGRLAYRIIVEQKKDIEIVAVNLFLLFNLYVKYSVWQNKVLCYI